MCNNPCVVLINDVLILFPTMIVIDPSSLDSNLFVGEFGRPNEFELKTEHKVVAGIVTVLLVVLIIALVVIVR